MSMFAGDILHPFYQTTAPGYIFARYGVHHRMIRVGNHFDGEIFLVVPGDNVFQHFNSQFGRDAFIQLSEHP